MAKNRVARSLYRSLLKIAQNFEGAPACKSLIYRTDLYNTNKNPTAKYYTSVLDKLFAKDSFLLQPKDDTISIIELIRQESRITNDKYSASDRLDAGFVAMRKLSLLWSIYKNHGNEEVFESDGEEFDPSAEFKSPVTLASALASGVLLLAHPILQGPLHRSVILLLEHNSRGSYGVVINHRTCHSVKSSVKNLPENVVNTFGSNPVAFGGMVRRLTYLHDVAQVGGIAIPTCRTPLFAGGDIMKALAFVKEEKAKLKSKKSAAAKAASMVLNSTVGAILETDATVCQSKSSAQVISSQADVGCVSGESRQGQIDEPIDRFRFFVGCCLWEGDNLEKELASGYWIPVHAEPDTVLDLAMSTAVGPMSDENENESDVIEEEPEDIVEQVQRSSGRSRRPPVVRGLQKGDRVEEGVHRVVGVTRNEVRDDETRTIHVNVEVQVEVPVYVTRSVKSSRQKKEEEKEVTVTADVADAGSASREDRYDEEDEEDFNDDDEDQYSIDVWKALLHSLGEPYSDMSHLPSWVSAKDVESSDWK